MAQRAPCWGAREWVGLRSHPLGMGVRLVVPTVELQHLGWLAQRWQGDIC